jgi:hypothetical protein
LVGAAGARRRVKPQLEFLMHLAVDVGEVASMGHGPLGERRVVGILAGTFEGPDLRGEVLAGGADWQIVRKDGVLDLDAHYALKEQRGGLVRVTSQGYRHGSGRSACRARARRRSRPGESISFAR